MNPKNWAPSTRYYAIALFTILFLYSFGVIEEIFAFLFLLTASLVFFLGKKPQDNSEYSISGLNFFESINTCYKKYGDFNGKASRSEFWWFFLFILFTYLLVVFITSASPELGAVLGLVAVVGTIIPHISVSVRRFHDINMSGWFVLLMFIPLVNLGALGMFAQKGSSTIDKNELEKNVVGSDFTNICKSCGAENSQGEDTKFCNNCGENLKNICKSCGLENPNGEDIKFCNNCGEDLKNN